MSDLQFTSLNNNNEDRKNSSNTSPYRKSPKNNSKGNVKQKANTIYRKKQVKLDLSKTFPNIVENITVYTKEKLDSPFTDFTSVFDFDRTNPTSIVHIDPPLYKEFINKISSCIDPLVYPNEKVTTKHLYRDNLPEGIVSHLRFSNLKNMTVIIAVLTDGREYLSYHLEKVKRK